MFKTNTFNPGGTHLVTDNKHYNPIFTGFDMSIGADYGFFVVTDMLSNRDTVPGTDTLRPSKYNYRRKEA